MSVEAQFERVMRMAVKQRASDIYWLPTETGYHVFLQVAGHRQSLMTVAAEPAHQLINHIKYRGNMAISDHRRPQLGALKLMLDGQPLNLRLSTVGDFGARESLVVRLLYRLNDGGLQYLIPEQRSQLRSRLSRPGLMLFSGPMGAGKTTTMYELVRELGREQLVMTIEDPVEIYELRFLQLQVNATAQMAYGDLLKVGLRHHPDVFIIGEIRDAETAQVAVQAALSGHLVLSTVHARGVYGIAPRLEQLGIASATLQQALTVASYQRLLTLTDGTQATLFDVTTDLSSRADPSQLMTPTWGRLIDEQLATGRVDRTTADQLKALAALDPATTSATV